MWGALVLIMIALSERLWFDLGPNVELVTTASVLAGLYLKGHFRWMVPVVIMAVSDAVLGVGWISGFVWSGFVLMGYLPGWMEKWGWSRWWRGVGAGLVGNLVFYWWTNLGVWLTDKWGMYEKNATGLVEAMVAGLPFLKLQLVSTLVFLPVAILVVEEVKSWVFEKKSLSWFS